MLTKEEIRFARRAVCKACRLDGACANPYMTGRGKDDRPLIAFVGDFPGPYEDKVGTLFTGGNGDLVRGIMKDLGLVMNRDCYMTTAIRCKPADFKAKDDHVKLCREYLIDDLIRVAPTVVVTLGATAMFALTGEKRVKEERGAPRRVTLQSMTGSGETLSTVVLPTVHPSFVIRNGSSLKFLIKDLQRALEIAQSGGDIPEKPVVSYRVVSTKQDLIEFKKEIRASKRIAWDTETTGVNPFAADAQIVCVTFTTKPGSGWLVPLHTIERENPQSIAIKLSLRECIDLVKWVLTLKRYFIGQNLKFDELFVRKTLGFVPRSASFDCSVGRHLLDEEASKHGTPSLKTFAYEFTLMGGYEKAFLEKYPNAYKDMKNTPILDDEFEASLLYYACADTDVAIQVCDEMLKQLKAENLMSTLSLEMQKLQLLVDMEERGVRVDKEFNAFLQTEFPKTIDDLTERLRQFPEIRQVEKMLSKNSNQTSFLETKEKFNPRSGDQIRTLCLKVLGLPEIEGKKTGTGKQQTDEESLSIWCSMLDERSSASEIMKTIVEISKLQKLYGTYVRPFSEIWDADGFLHSSFNSVGTVTWRLASSGPNVQNIPRAEDERRGWIKRQFIGGRDGWWVAEADYSQIELRILALVSQDEKMLEAYFNNEDIHAKTASEIFKVHILDVTKVQRTRAKGVNFGNVYGQTEEGLAELIGVSVEEARNYLAAFYNSFSGAAEWIEETRQFALENGYTQTLFGHKRRLDNVYSRDTGVREKALRQGVNSVIQGTASNMAIYAEMYLNKLLQREGFKSYCFGQVHDSLWLTGPPEERETVVELTVDVMENLPFDFLTGNDSRFPNVPPIIADIAIGDNLRDLVQLKKDNLVF